MKSWFIIVASTCLLTGCTLWSDFKPVEIAPIPNSWKTELEGKAAVWPDAEWWQGFKSPQLTAQIEEVEHSNFDLKSATAKVRQADAKVIINGASLLPNVNASIGANRSRQPGSRRGSQVIAPYISNTYNGGINASYELDFWGKNRASDESVIALAEASRFDRDTVRLTTLSATAITYFDILGTKELLKVAHENFTNAQALLDSIQSRFKAGIVSSLDVAQQEGVVAAQRAAIPPLQQHLQQDLDALAILLGKMPENVEVPVENLNDVAIPAIIQGLPSELLTRRPDVQKAEANLKSAHADIINARAAFFPNITLTAGGGNQSNTLSNLFRPDSMLWSLASSTTQPIFEGDLLEGKLDLQKAYYDELLQEYQKAVISAFSDVEDALTAVQQTNAEEEAQQATVNIAQNAYKLTQQQMQGGIIDITKVLDTQRTLFTSEVALVQARLAHLEAIVSLYKALGGGWKNQSSTPIHMLEASPYK